MTDLDKLRDEMAEKDMNSTYVNLGRSFHRGWDALLSHLTEAAGSFDESAVTKEINRMDAFALGGPDICEMIDLARWQFEQNAARIGRAVLFEKQCLEVVEHNNKVIKHLEARLADSEETLAIYRERQYATKNAELEAHLEEVTRDLEALKLYKQGGVLDFAGINVTLRDKLSACEQRCKELRKELKGAWAMVNG